MGSRDTPLRLAELVHVLLRLLVTDGVLLQVMLGVTEFVHDGVWVPVHEINEAAGRKHGASQTMKSRAWHMGGQ